MSDASVSETSSLVVQGLLPQRKLEPTIPHASRADQRWRGRGGARGGSQPPRRTTWSARSLRSTPWAGGTAGGWRTPAPAA